MALLERLARFIPQPGRHMTRYSGVLSSGAAWRARIIPTPPEEPEFTPLRRRGRRLDWANLLGRVFLANVLTCACGDPEGDLRDRRRTRRPEDPQPPRVTSVIPSEVEGRTPCPDPSASAIRSEVHPERSRRDPAARLSRMPATRPASMTCSARLPTSQPDPCPTPTFAPPDCARAGRGTLCRLRQRFSGRARRAAFQTSGGVVFLTRRSRGGRRSAGRRCWIAGRRLAPAPMRVHRCRGWRVHPDRRWSCVLRVQHRSAGLVRPR